MGIDNEKLTAQDYRNRKYKVFENADLGTLNGTFAFKEDRAIALCLYLGNAHSLCWSVTGARKVANELLTMYSRTYRKSFPVSTDGLALELMYHAIPDDILSILKFQTLSIPLNIIAIAIDEFKGVTTSCYWADSGAKDELRALDKYATSILNLLS